MALIFFINAIAKPHVKILSSRLDWAFATETIDMGSINSWGEPKTLKIDIHNFPAWRSALKGHCEISTVCGRLG